MTAISANLTRELDWLERVIDAAIRGYFSEEEQGGNVRAISPPDLAADTSSHAAAIRCAQLGFDERLILILSLAPEIKPQTLDPFLIRNSITDRSFTVFGGVVSAQGGFLPTVETALFVLSGGSLERRFQVLRQLQPEASLVVEKFIQQPMEGAQSLLSQQLQMDANRLALVTTGAPHRPAYRADFPASRLTTALEWEDLILPRQTLHEVGEIQAWLDHGDALMAEPGVGRMIRRGYRSLFYGPPGTGKTLTATLLGKGTKRDVYRVDLSMIVSKWIGETEKNLASVFDQAEGNGWILFFDEADALFGKRTEVSHANDRYANQEVSYILQRVEDFDGIVLLASNLKGNIDSAFARRFQSIIRFPVPGPRERLRLWQNALANPEQLDADVDIKALAQNHELTGGAIVNVLRYCLLAARRHGRSCVTLADLQDGIGREMRKDGKIPEMG